MDQTLLPIVLRRTLAVAACIGAATALVTYTLPKGEVVVAEVESMHATADWLARPGGSSAGAIGRDVTPDFSLWLGVVSTSDVAADVAPLDSGVARPRLDLQAGSLPTGMSDILARLVPLVADDSPDRLVGWQWQSVGSEKIVEVVRDAVTEARTNDRDDPAVVRWEPDALQPLVAFLDAEETRLARFRLDRTPTRLERAGPCVADRDLEVLPARLAASTPPPHHAAPSVGEGILEIERVVVPAWCLQHQVEQRLIALDPATGHQLDDGTNTLVHVGPIASGRGSGVRDWGRCAEGSNGRWEALKPGDAIGSWEVVACPGLDEDREMALAEARWCDRDPQCQAPRYGWYSPKVGESPVVIGGTLLARPGRAGSIALSRWTRPGDGMTSGPTVAVATAGSDAFLPLGAVTIPLDRTVHLLVRAPGDKAGTLLAIRDVTDDQGPTLEVALLRDRYMPDEDVHSRAIVFPSMQPGTWRYLPAPTAGRLDPDGNASIIAPGAAEFRWEAGIWRTTSTLVRAVNDDAGPGNPRRFRTPEHVVRVEARDATTFVGWAIFLAVTQVLTCLALCVFLATGRQRLEGIDAIAAWISGVAIGALVGLGVAQVALAGISPLGQNSTLFLGQHLSWLVIGTGVAWVFASVLPIRDWLEREPARLKPIRTSTTAGLLALGTLPVVLDGAFGGLFLPDAMRHAWAPSSWLVLCLGLAGMVFAAITPLLRLLHRHLSDRLLSAVVAARLGDIAFLFAGVVLLAHAGSGRGWGSSVAAIVASSPARLLASLVGLASAALAVRAIWLLVENARPAAWTRHRSLRLVLGGLAGLAAVFGALYLLSSGGALGKATFPDALAMAVCFALARRAFKPTSRESDLKYVTYVGSISGLVFLATALLSHDLGTTLVRVTAVFATTWWCTLRLRGARNQWIHVVPPIAAIGMAAAGKTILTWLPIYLAMTVLVFVFEKARQRFDDETDRLRAWRLIDSLPLWLVGLLLAGLATRGVATTALAWIGPQGPDWLVNTLVRMEERDMCSGVPELWGFCEQLLDARRLWTTRLGDWPADVVASNMHSDLAWAHSVHLGWGLVAVLAVAAIATIAVGVAFWNARNATGRFRLNSIVIAGATGAAMVPLLSAGLHVLGMRGIVPLSGVPWVLLSYANTNNAMFIVFLAIVAFAVWRDTDDDEVHQAARFNALIPGTLVSLTLLGATMAISWPEPPLDWAQEIPPVMLGHRDVTSSTERLETAPATSPDDWTGVCDTLVSPVRLQGQVAQAGPSRLVGGRLVRIVQSVEPDAATGAPIRAALLSGWFLPDDSPPRLLCSDPSCDWFVDPRFGAALDRLEVTHRADRGIAVRIDASLDPNRRVGDIIRGRSLGDALTVDAPDTRVLVAATREDLASLDPTTVSGFHLVTSGGRYVLVPVRIPATGNPGTLLCILAGPHFTMESATGTAPLAWPLKIGVWPQKDTSSTALELPATDCGDTSCRLRSGWPSRWKASPAHRIPRYSAEIRDAAWQQIRMHGGTRTPWTRLAAAQSLKRSSHGLTLRGLAAQRYDTLDGRRMVRSALQRVLASADAAGRDAAMDAQMGLDVLGPTAFALAQEISRPASDPAITWRPRRARRYSWTSIPTPRAELRWEDRIRTFGTPVTLFLDPTHFGVGRPARFEAHAFWLRLKPPESDTQRARMPTPRPALRLSGRWTMDLEVHDPSLDSLAGQPDATQGWLNPEARLVRAGPQAPESSIGRLEVRPGSGCSDCEPILLSPGVRETIEWPIGSTEDGWKGWVIQSGPFTPAPRDPEAQASRTQRRSTNVVLRDLVGPLDAVASDRNTYLTLDPDIQTVVEHEIFDWLTDAMHRDQVHRSDYQNWLGSRRDASADGAGIGRSRPAPLIRVTAFLVDYRNREVLGLAEAIGSERMAMDFRRYAGAPLFVDGNIETASTIKPLMAVLGQGVGSAEPGVAECTGRMGTRGQTRLSGCDCPGGSVDLAMAMQESCNHFLPQWRSDLLEPARWQDLVERLQRMGLYDLETLRIAPADDLRFELDPKRRFDFDLPQFLPASWAGGIHSMRLEDPWPVGSPQHCDGDQAACARSWRLAFWSNGLAVFAPPWWLASLYANLAGAWLGNRTPGSATQGTAAEDIGDFRWLRVTKAPNPVVVASETLAGSALQEGIGTTSAAVMDQILDGMGGSLLFGSGSDDRLLSETANTLHLVGKTGTSTSRARRNWQHLVSLVDPRTDLATQRPWLLWVTVEAESETASQQPFPSALRATHLAGRLWAALAGVPVETAR